MAEMAEDRVDRRLAAIFAGDIAGYSRLMGVDEEGTLRQLKAHRKELVDPKITEHRGRIVKTTGDGMLVEFVSVVDAVRCAVDIQRGMAERNSTCRRTNASNSASASMSATLSATQRYIWRRRQRSGSAGSARRPRRDHGFTHCPRPGPRQAQLRLQRHGRAARQEHCATDWGSPGLSH